MTCLAPVYCPSISSHATIYLSVWLVLLKETSPAAKMVLSKIIDFYFYIKFNLIATYSIHILIGIKLSFKPNF